ncbi:sulfur carrier protein ThiS [Desulfovibrio litoralis]|uniref:Sulfur carrier protein n=1 Tax=Desulfovibrio litoralis DSM 11393 TaxID=1121455 RepID=A0A1M7RR11_9BACT|nr:sulfur carrier protein ThiS [Desulfovibrio litoralis]SHN48669.1 sulfur carrier protein [Desulfovibrio litoralis DSM 11393]
MPNSSFEITVNGEQRFCAHQQTVLELLQQLNLQPETVVVEINQEIIPLELYKSHIINPKDNVEIVYFVGGG